jgi:hypothetical protein
MNSQRRYKYLVVGRDIFYFVNNHSDSTKAFSETEIINMLECFIENTFAMPSGRVSQQTVLAAFKSLKIDVERLFIDPLRFVILICISDLTLFTHSE